jgi:uncharacterized protein (DUF427 family)
MPKAIWKSRVIAQSDKVEIVEGNTYFPADAVQQEFLRPSATSTICPWKGTAGYFTLIVDGQENSDAAWIYRDPKPAAANIKNMIAFWRGVQVVP